jgi:hypothetical protein
MEVEMNSWPKVLLAATVLLCAVSGVEAFAASYGGYGRGAPGPVAGAGLPFLLAAGGYALARWKRIRSKTK